MKIRQAGICLLFLIYACCGQSDVFDPFAENPFPSPGDLPTGSDVSDNNFSITDTLSNLGLPTTGLDNAEADLIDFLLGNPDMILGALGNDGPVLDVTTASPTTTSEKPTTTTQKTDSTTALVETTMRGGGIPVIPINHRNTDNQQDVDAHGQTENIQNIFTEIPNGQQNNKFPFDTTVIPNMGGGVPIIGVKNSIVPLEPIHENHVISTELPNHVGVETVVPIDAHASGLGNPADLSDIHGHIGDGQEITEEPTKLTGTDINTPVPLINTHGHAENPSDLSNIHGHVGGGQDITAVPTQLIDTDINTPVEPRNLADLSDIHGHGQLTEITGAPVTTQPFLSIQTTVPPTVEIPTTAVPPIETTMPPIITIPTTVLPAVDMVEPHTIRMPTTVPTTIKHANDEVKQQSPTKVMEWNTDTSSRTGKGKSSTLPREIKPRRTRKKISELSKENRVKNANIVTENRNTEIQPVSPNNNKNDKKRLYGVLNKYKSDYLRSRKQNPQKYGYKKVNPNINKVLKWIEQRKNALRKALLMRKERNNNRINHFPTHQIINLPPTQNMWNPGQSHQILSLDDHIPNKSVKNQQIRRVDNWSNSQRRPIRIQQQVKDQSNDQSRSMKSVQRKGSKLAGAYLSKFKNKINNKAITNQQSGNVPLVQKHLQRQNIDAEDKLNAGSKLASAYMSNLKNKINQPNTQRKNLDVLQQNLHEQNIGINENINTGSKLAGAYMSSIKSKINQPKAGRRNSLVGQRQTQGRNTGVKDGVDVGLKLAGTYMSNLKSKINHPINKDKLNVRKNNIVKGSNNISKKSYTSGLTKKFAKSASNNAIQTNTVKKHRSKWEKSYLAKRQNPTVRNNNRRRNKPSTWKKRRDYVPGQKRNPTIWL